MKFVGSKKVKESSRLRKTHILGLQAFLLDKFNLWAGNGRFIEGKPKIFKDVIFEGIKRYVPQEILSKNLDPE